MDRDEILQVLKPFADLYDRQFELALDLMNERDVPITDDDSDSFVLKIGALHEANRLYEKLTKVSPVVAQ